MLLFLWSLLLLFIFWVPTVRPALGQVFTYIPSNLYNTPTRRVWNTYFTNEKTEIHGGEIIFSKSKWTPCTLWLCNAAFQIMLFFFFAVQGHCAIQYNSESSLSMVKMNNFFSLSLNVIPCLVLLACAVVMWARTYLQGWIMHRLLK